ncbi:fimbrial protein [Bordetella petrii]|uniref:Type-1 fimbrial protein n=1 Tax=Bordetella petrii (strain ATCC BAA-461 / DSM 12804 / CCUG 43448 / CIP 107267 / Se-1111R) TaxID=340100 RepID=A9IDE7_BORPD|nr:fimbrial protein [Bordetella petrii]CAP44816.1 type-1 fimbrial protein [Bordetella petrii]
MKLSRIAGLLAGAGILAAAHVAAAADGTITFTGQILATSCTINVNGKGNANDTVALPQVNISALATTAATAGWTPFEIKLTGCQGPLVSAMANFEPGPNVTPQGRLKNIATVLPASAVDIALRQAGSTNNIVVGSAASTQSTPVSFNTGAATLQYEAGYYATAPATAGAVESNVTYSIVYQ